MAYQDDEVSTSDASPIELYTFVGTYTTYRYTSAAATIVSNGNTFNPIPIKRDSVTVATQEKSEAVIQVTLPFDNPMVTNYAYGNAPPDLTMTLERAHETDLDDTITMWNGRVTAFSVSGRTAKMKIPSKFSYILEGNAPSPRYQAPCNHVLYDEGCGIAATSHQQITTVSSVVANIIAVDALSFAADEGVGGLIFNDTGESRMIISHVGTSITVAYPFANLAASDNVTIRKGCDHALNGDCINRFSNASRFGGFPIVPAKNPFTSSLT